MDAERCIIFNQSMIPAHAELAWILGCLTPLGWLNRMTQFKEKAPKDRNNAGLGLYAYPVLMAADILGYKATLNGAVYQFNVPRGDTTSDAGMAVPPAMGMAIPINFQPTGDGKAAITGDFVLLASEVTPEVTYLGAHVVPAEYADDPAGYVALVTGEMLDACAPRARWVDVFCERGAFDADQSRAVLQAGGAAGMRGSGLASCRVSCLGSGRGSTACGCAGCSMS